MSQENIEVRGYSSLHHTAPRPLRALSALLDLFIISALNVSSFRIFKLAPTPKIGPLTLFIFIGLLYWLGQRATFGVTLGERLWKIKPSAKDRFKPFGTSYQQDYFEVQSIFISCFTTTLTILISLTFFNETFLKHPLWIKGSIWKIAPFIPTPDRWIITPFFYALGGWPRTFEDQAIYYSIPYEKGPPTHFIGRIIGHWDTSDIKLMIEGPKTPDGALDRASIKECILSSFSYRCINSRESTLMRHIREIQSISPQTWTLNWFSVENPSLPPESQAQGIYLSASSFDSIQDRFILINNKGTHQAVILYRPPTEKGNQAFDLIKKAIGSMRNFDELESGRLWVNHELGTVRLDKLKASHSLSELVGIQSFLISKISVDPASFEAFFHLAGTSSIILKDPDHSTENDNHNEALKQNIKSAFHFAQDISPKDPRLTQLQELLMKIR